MGMHPLFQADASFLVADALVGADGLTILQDLVNKKLVSGDTLEAWLGVLKATRPGTDDASFKMLDYLKLRVDPRISQGGLICEKSSLDIVVNYRAVSNAFCPGFFQPPNLQGKVALDFGAGVYRPLGVAIILYVNGFDRAYAFEPFPLKEGFPHASLMQLVGEMLVRPARFDLSGIGEEAILDRLQSLDLRGIDGKIAALAGGGGVLDLGGVIFTRDESNIPDGVIDAHFSNAVLEHVQDMAACSRLLHRVGAPGSAGFHVVDFLDHRHYDFKTHPFEKYYDGELYEINGLVPAELESAFLGSGWNLNKINLQSVPENWLLNDARKIIPRYAGWPMSELCQHLNAYHFIPAGSGP